ncbi:MAG: diphthamide synthesis protein [Nanoarchaeota archaeon]
MPREKKTISELEQKYDLELGKIVENIKKEKAKKVLLQFPDGLKPYATTIADELESKCKNVEFFIWLGSCYGACDIPSVPENLKVDLIVQFGHSSWNYKDKELSS